MSPEDRGRNGTATLSHDERRFRKLRRLTEVSRALTYAASLEEVLSIAVNRAVELLDAERSALLLTDEEGLLVVRASSGIVSAAARQFRAPPTETLSERIHDLLGATPETFLGVPLVSGGSVIGLLAVGGRQPTMGTDEAEWLLSALADQAAVALEKARQDDVAVFRQRLLGIVGHDLRNPLSAIRGSAEVMLRRATGGADAEALQRIVRSSKRIEEIIDALLDVTRGELGGGIRIEPRTTDLHELCRAVIAETLLAYPDARISFVPDGDGRGSWDPGRLAQLLSNLLRNAVQHGTGARVEVRARAEGADEVLEVRNEGAPIPPELLPHLFDAFRGGRASKGTSPGLGLGLYIAREVVRAHGGRIDVRSSAAEGTEFTVRLPRGTP